MAERVLVIGNCQAPSVAQLISHIVQDVSAEGFALNLGEPAKHELAERVAEFDVVFAQPHEHAKAGPLAFSELQRRHSCVVAYPQIIFSGFHPDFIGGGESKQVRSAALSYHSLIVAAAYANRVPVGEVGKLFTPFTFARLGYYKEYQSGKAYLLSKAKELDYDLADDFQQWEAGGAFMHTPNHPAIHVLARVASKAASRAGLRVSEALADGVEDRLGRLVRLPVYPALAKRLNVSANASFRLREPHGTRVFDLPEYISVTYDMYASAPPSFFEQRSIQRVAAALRDPG